MESGPALRGFSWSGAIMLLFGIAAGGLSAHEAILTDTLAPWVGAPGFVAMGLWGFRHPIDWRGPLRGELARLRREAPARPCDLIIGAVGSTLVVVSAALRLLGI